MKAQNILDALACGRSGCACGAAARRGAGQTHCPAHDDERPSLSVTEPNEKVLVHCHAGCAQDAVVAALRERSLWPSIEPRTQHRRIVAAYPYTDETGALLSEAIRYEPKDFSQRRPDGNNGWIWNLEGVERVLYNLPAVVSVVGAARGEPGDAAWTVFVTEGEKDADALNALGLVATTNSGGAGNWRDEYADTLAGTHIVVIADKDEAGKKHAEQVAASCARTAKTVKIIEMPGDHVKDVSDWLSAGGTRAELEELADAAPTPRPRPAPLFTQQQQVLTTLVDEWDGMTAEERKRMLAAIFDSVTASAEGVDRMEPCEDWRPYIVAAIPKPVTLLRASTERKTGVEGVAVALVRLRLLDDGRVGLQRAA